MTHKLYWLNRWQRDRCEAYRQGITTPCKTCTGCPYDYNLELLYMEEYLEAEQ